MVNAQCGLPVKTEQETNSVTFVSEINSGEKCRSASARQVWVILLHAPPAMDVSVIGDD